MPPMKLDPEAELLVAQDETRWVNPANGRCIALVPFGIACYEGTFEADTKKYSGNHVGMVGTADDAETWLAGGQPETIYKIHPVRLEGGEEN